MKDKKREAFQIFDIIFLSIITLLCLFPLVHILALSFSSAAYVDSGMVTIIPKGFTLAAYKFVIGNESFWQAFGITFQRLLLGIPINLLMCILMAYPMSKDSLTFPARKYYMGIFMFVMVFNAGLVPNYLLVQKLGLLDTIWALILPVGLNVFNAVIMMNFFRTIPKSIEESALIDGANQWTILWRIILPLAVPCIATITLFSFMTHWNSWMDGKIYMNYAENYPLQTYLQGLMNSTNAMMDTTNLDSMVERMLVNGRNLRAAQLFVSVIPVLLVYPFLQKYFTTGLVVGSVKE